MSGKRKRLVGWQASCENSLSADAQRRSGRTVSKPISQSSYSTGKGSGSEISARHGGRHAGPQVSQERYSTASGEQ